MTRNKYVDIDLYGRGFDGIFGHGAEQENKRQALMKFKAMQRFKERIKPGEYIDLDLYGRGDPRVFGPDAHLHTQKQAKKLMEEAQSRKRDGHVNHAFIMLPVGLKAITRKARQLVKRSSSKRSETSEVQSSGFELPVDEKVNDDREGATEDPLIPAVGKIKEEQSTLEDPGIENSTPRRFKSKLPSEEVTPQVEQGAVARAVKSISSQDNIEDINIVETNRNKPVLDPAHIPAHSSIAPRPLFPHKDSGSGSSRSAESSGSHNLQAASGEDHSRRLPDPVSTRSEAEVARDIVVGSDEEFQLSFSTNVRNGDRIEYNSTSSDEDMVVRQPSQERVLVDTAGRTSSTGNKITGLFRSGDSDNGSERRVSSEASGGESGSSHSKDAYSSTGDDSYYSTEGEDVSTDEADEIVDDSPNETGPDDIDAKNEARQVAEAMGAQPAFVSREASIVNVVETEDLVLDNELADDSNSDVQEDMDARAATESAVADETTLGNVILEADEEPANLVEEAGHGSSSSRVSASTEGVDSSEQGDASITLGDTDGSAYVTDSDRSGEAASSSVVMSSSPEEDSDDVEFETSGDVEEESEEAEEIEEEDVEEREESSFEEALDGDTEDYGDARVVSSSDAEMTSVEDNNAGESMEAENTDQESNRNAAAGNAQGEGDEGTSFWQRLNFFGTFAQGSWNLY